MIGGCAVKYQSVMARIETCDRLMSRLLSWKTYLPQYGTPGTPPRPPPPPPPAAGVSPVVSPPVACGAAPPRPPAPGVGEAQLTIAVEPVDVAVASVGIGHRCDRDEDVVANLLDERRRLGREPVGQLHQHFGRPGLAAVEPAHQVVLRPGRGDQLTDLRRRAAARIRDASEVVAVLRQVLDVLVRRDPDDHELTVFVGFADRLNLDPAGNGCRQRAVVLQDVGVVGELRGCADVIPEHVLRGGHAVHLRQVVDQRADEIRLRRPVLHRFGEVLVLRLRGVFASR